MLEELPVTHAMPDERARRALAEEPLPTRPDPWRLFTGFNPSVPRLPGALRAAIAVTVPGALALALGHDNATVLIASGGFVVILLFGVVHHFGVSGYGLLLALAASQFGAEFFVTRNYALTVICTTPLALLMGDSMSQPFGEVFAARTVEVVISVVFGSLFLWVWRPGAERSHHYRLQIRCRKAMGSLLGALLVTPPAGSKEERRDLQYELLSERQAANSLAVNHPDAALAVWADHVDVQRAGYAVLDYCSAHNDDMLDAGQVQELAGHLKRAL